MRIAITVALLSIVCTVSPAFAAERPNAVFVLHGSGVAVSAFRTFETTVGANACDCIITDETLSAERLKAAKLLFLEHPSPDFLARLKETALEAIRGGLIVVSDVPEMVQRGWESDPSLPVTQKMLPYWQNGGEDNMLGFFLTAFQAAGGPANLTIPAPRETPKMGVYHPDAPQLFDNLTDYLAWYRKEKPGQGALAVVNFYATYLNKRDLAFVDAMLRELEKQGLAAAGVVGWPISTLDSVFATPASDPMKVLLTFTLGLSRPDDPAFLEKLNVHTINLMTTPDSYEEWAKTDRGVTPSREASSLSAPERAGATDPILVATTESGTGGELPRTMPIPERVEMAAKRAKRWVELTEKSNEEKRIAILYYNNPPGKGNIGASYLNVAPSIRNVLVTLQKNGYNVGSEIPSADSILEQLERVGRNIEAWEPGELEKMIAQGGATLLPVERYKQWFSGLPKEFRDSIDERWGPPEAAKLMAWTAADGRKYFVIPGLRFGNVFLGPQLLRASSAEYTNVQHSSTLPPHHAYVAAYLYYRNEFHADAIIHMGRHGTLEWLPGKNAGQAGWDTSEVLLGDLPDVYYYIMDGDGEAIQALRRAAAVEISHLTPMLARAGEEDRFHDLDEALEQWQNTRETAPIVAAEYEAAATGEIEKLGLAKQLGIENMEASLAFPKVRQFLDSIEEAPIPLGLPTLGVPPSEDRQRAGLLAFMQSAFEPDELARVGKQLPSWSDALFEARTPATDDTLEMEAPLKDKVGRTFDEARTWLDRLRQSAPRELDMLPRVLRGEFIASGPVGDPLALPDSLPSGRNLHQGDPSLLPTPAAWEAGKKLAGALLERYQKDHGEYPDHISMILWQGESGRNQGAMEAESLYLMGIEPEWNARGVPDRLKIIPDEVLGRPRVNVVFTVSGLYRDGMADKVIFLDRAGRLAASAGDNALSRQNRDVTQRLIAGGMDEKEAAELAGARVFATAPGSYGFGLDRFVEQSRDKDEPQTMAELYLSKMNYVYSETTWGRTVPKLLDNQLRGNQSIVQSRSSNLYGAVDGDDVYQWMGGLRVASATVGANPDMMINNLRRPGDPKLEDARSFIAAELNARNWNPKWISEMQKEGYSGARTMMNSVEYLYGWQATAPQTVAPEVWQKMYDVYVGDEYKLDLPKFLERANPAAEQVMIGRLLEVDRQGVYRFSPAQRTQMLKEYVRLVSSHGVACSANTCGNPQLQQHILKEAARLSKTDLTKKQIENVKKQFQEAANPRPHETVQRKTEVVAKAIPQKEWKVKLVDVAAFEDSIKRAVVKNPWLLAGLSLALVVCGALIAWTKRRPEELVELGLGAGR